MLYQRSSISGSQSTADLMSDSYARSSGGNLHYVTQGMMITEMWIDRIARTVGKSPEEIRLLNLYRENDKTYYGQVLDCCQLRACWDHVRIHILPRPSFASPHHSARSGVVGRRLPETANDGLVLSDGWMALCASQTYGPAEVAAASVTLFGTS